MKFTGTWAPVYNFDKSQFFLSSRSSKILMSPQIWKLTFLDEIGFWNDWPDENGITNLLKKDRCMKSVLSITACLPWMFTWMIPTSRYQWGSDSTCQEASRSFKCDWRETMKKRRNPSRPSYWTQSTEGKPLPSPILWHRVRPFYLICYQSRSGMVRWYLRREWRRESLSLVS